MPPLGGLPPTSHEFKQGKRVWVPYNKKLRLKGMQASLQQTQTHLY